MSFVLSNLPFLLSFHCSPKRDDFFPLLCVSIQYEMCVMYFCLLAVNIGCP